LQISVLENSAHRKLGPMTPVLVGLPVFLLGCLFNIEVQLKFRLMCLILRVYTYFYQVGNWHRGLSRVRRKIV